MPRFIASATEFSTLSSVAPTSQEIQAALVLPERAGRWVGPAPRVTRTNQIGVSDPWRTTFAWPIDLQGSSETEVAYNRAAIQVALQATSPSGIAAWSQVSLVPYSEALNGPESFWTSGNAARTRTRDDWSTTTDRLLAPDNPIGPDDPSSRNPTPGETLDQGTRQIVSTATGLLIAAGALGLSYLGGTAAGASRRRNPVGRRPRKRSDDSWPLPVILLLPP